MEQIANPLEIIKALGGDERTSMCSCPGHDDRKPSLWISPEGKGLKCHAGCTYKSVVAAIRARGIEVRYEGGRSDGTGPKLPPAPNVNLDEAQRFLDLIDPDAKSWTFQVFSDDGKHPNLAQIVHGTLKECATELKKKSRYGAGIFVCPQRTDLKGRKRENVTAIRLVSVDLDGSPLEPVQQCELPPHVIVETSPARYQAHWCAKDISLDEFAGIVCGIAKRFGGDYAIAEVHHCCRLPGFEHCKNPANRFQVHIVENLERAPYGAEEIRRAFPPVMPSNPLDRPTPKTTGGAPAPIFMSPTAKRGYDEAKAKTDRYCGPTGGPPLPPEVESKLDELADLHPFDYERERKEAAKDMGVRAGELDKEVERRREDSKIEPFMVPVKPWPEPVDGDLLLTELGATFTRHLVLPKHAPITMGLFTIHTHAHDLAQHSPNLSFTSPAMRCGKTSALWVTSYLVPLPLVSSNVTLAVIIRAITKYKPTLLLDELDTYLHSEKRELIGILNSGHSRFGSYSMRCVGDQHELAHFSTWSAKVFAAIGKIPPTLVDRSMSSQ